MLDLGENFRNIIGKQEDDNNNISVSSEDIAVEEVQSVNRVPAGNTNAAVITPPPSPNPLTGFNN